MLEFPTRAERGHLSYRELVADSLGEVEQTHQPCPACGFRWGRVAAIGAPPSMLVPVGLPERTDEEREERRRALQPTAGRIAELVASTPGLSESTFAIWLGPLVLDDTTRDTLFLAAPPPLASWVADRYTPLLMRAAELLAGRAVCVQIYPADRPGALTIGELSPAATASTEAAA